MDEEQKRSDEEILSTPDADRTELLLADFGVFPKNLAKKRSPVPEWAIVVITVFCSIVLGIFAHYVVAANLIGHAAGGSSDGSNAYAGPAEPYIAKIKIVGQISDTASSYASSDNAYHHDWTMETIDTLISDSNNKGIYLWLDTPGGGVYESDELYLKLMEYKEETERPVYVYMGQMAASGGYYIAASADGIYANRNTWTGSIGVMLGTLFDVSEFLEEYGIHTNTITSGSNKAMGSYYEPLTEEQRAIYQSLVDEAYDQFVSVVVAGRGLAEKDVRALADGRVYTAAQALEAGLIDEILGEQEAEKAIKEKCKDGEDGGDGIVISNCYYRPATNYLSFLGASAYGVPNIFDLLRWNAIVPSGEPPDRTQDKAPDDTSVNVYEGDVAAVLDLVRAQETAGSPPLQYLYIG